MRLISTIKDIGEQWKALIVSILIVLLTGVFPSIYFSDWTWFSRSGALLISYGIYIVWLDYKGSIDEGLTKVAAAAENKFGKLDQELFNAIESIRVSNKKQYQTMEFLIVGVGTLICSYGDLVG